MRIFTFGDVGLPMFWSSSCSGVILYNSYASTFNAAKKEIHSAIYSICSGSFHSFTKYQQVKKRPTLNIANAISSIGYYLGGKGNSIQ